MPHRILQKLKLDGPVEMLPAGYHSSVLLVGGNDNRRVIKIISKPELTEMVIAQQLADDIQAYAQELQEKELVSPLIEIDLLGNGGLVDIVISSPFCGPDASRIMKSAPQARCQEIASKILDLLRCLFRHSLIPGGFELQTGIDPKPDNFTVDDFGVMNYIDLMPPRYRRDGVALLEFPEPFSAKGRQLAYFRHYDMRGILTVLQTQLCRVRPTLRPEFQKLIRQFIKEFRGNGLSDYFNYLPSFQFCRASQSERFQIVDSLHQDDIYSMRDIVCQLVSEQPDQYGEIEIEKVFHLSHFFTDAPPADKICLIKLILKEMIAGRSVANFLS